MIYDDSDMGCPIPNYNQTRYMTCLSFPLFLFFPVSLLAHVNWKCKFWCDGVIAVVISVTEEGVKFSTRGDVGTSNIVCWQNTLVDKVCICKLALMEEQKIAGCCGWLLCPGMVWGLVGDWNWIQRFVNRERDRGLVVMVEDGGESGEA